jgi:hypothetical protein
MQIIRIDHVHIKADDHSGTVKALEGMLGADFLLQEMDFEDEGMKVGYNPFPCGFEVMGVNDASKELAALYQKWSKGVFALSLKVADIKAATADMQAMGYKAIIIHEFGEVHEVLFDTTEKLGNYIELVQSPDDLTAEAAGF